MTTVGNRLRRARQAKNLTQQELASAIGARRNAVVAWEGDHRLPRDRYVEKLVEILGVPASTFNPYGSGTTSLAPPAQIVTIRQLTLSDINKIYAGGMDSSQEERVGTPVSVENTPVNPIQPGELRHIIEDDSMDDGTRVGLRKGDVVALSRNVSPRNGDLVIAYVHPDRSSVLREYRARGGDYFDLIAANPEWPTLTCNTATPIDIFAVVIRQLIMRR